MKALIKIVLALVVIGGLVLFFVSRQNNTAFTTKTIDLSVDCSDLDKILVTSAVNVAVQNHSFRTHKDISVKITAYDEAGKVLKEKYTTFSRNLPPDSFFDKPVTLPANTKRCDCKIVSSTPVEENAQ